VSGRCPLDPRLDVYRKDRPISAASIEFLVHGQPNAGGTLVETVRPRCTIPVDGQSVRPTLSAGYPDWICSPDLGECIVKKSIFPLSQWQILAHSAAKLTTQFNKTEASDFALLITHGNMVLPVVIRRVIKLIISREAKKKCTEPSILPCTTGSTLKMAKAGLS
jgi:hypothetical protein